MSQETSQMPSAVMFSVKCEDEADWEALQAEWGGRTSLDGPGCSFVLRRPRRLGMTSTELALNLALSFVSGVPASIVANWLWDKWARRGQRKIEINSEPITTREAMLTWVQAKFPHREGEPQDVGSAFHLQRLQVTSFKNIRDLDIHFSAYGSTDRHGTPPKRLRTHAVIGQNGSGKSNLIEAIITIFRDLDLDKEASFDYELTYSIRGNLVRLLAKTSEQKRPFVWVNGRQESQTHLLRNKQLLPSHIFAYYSGRNERIEELFQEHQRRFNRQQEISTSEKLSGDALANLYRKSDFDAEAAERLRADIESRDQRYGDDRLRRLFYCRGGHSQLVLLACLLSDDPVFRKVLKTLHIESLESALFVLKEPHRLREKRRNGKFDENEINEGDPRFWFARGNVVSEFLDKLWQVSWAPIEQEATKQIDFRGRTEKQKQLYMFVPSQEKLKQLGDLLGSADSFFRYAEGAYIGDLIDEVRITVKKVDKHGGKVSFTQLSEGELQMLTVLGLMRITREDQCLFLLDEPDTHLNPIWKLRYFDDIDGVLNSDDLSLPQGESQIIITTHDPMMVGSLKREQVHILRRDGERTLVDVPDEHPQGMGVTGLLKSELFGLSSTLDIETERRLFRRNELFVTVPRTAEEDAELSRLSAELADLGFSTADFRDPDYAMFVRKMAQYRRFRKPVLTPEEQIEQDLIAAQIIEEILREEDNT